MVEAESQENDAMGPPPPRFSQGWQLLLLWLLAVLLTAVWMASPESSRFTVAILAMLYAVALLATRRWLRAQKGRASRGPEPPTNY